MTWVFLSLAVLAGYGSYRHWGGPRYELAMGLFFLTGGLALAALFTWVWQVMEARYDAFTAECMQDHKHYECVTIWRASTPRYDPADRHPGPRDQVAEQQLQAPFLATRPQIGGFDQSSIPRHAVGPCRAQGGRKMKPALPDRDDP